MEGRHVGAWRNFTAVESRLNEVKNNFFYASSRVRLGSLVK